MFDYKQRPWSRPITDEEYDRAVGRLQDAPPTTLLGYPYIVDDSIKPGDIKFVGPEEVRER